MVMATALAASAGAFPAVSAATSLPQQTIATHLAAVPAPAPSTDVQQRLAALEAQLQAQQVQIAAQQKLIEAQQAALAQLTREATLPAAPARPPRQAADVFVVATPSPDATMPNAPASATLATARPSDAGEAPPSSGTDTLGAAVRRALTAAQTLATADAERPRLAVIGGRPTFASADGRYSLSIRGTVQLDAGAALQARQGVGLATDFRRGSVGAGGRESLAATDLGNGSNFRRARLGVEGILDRDFAYRLQLEYGGSGTEGPARINDAWIAYTGLAPFTVQIGAFSPPANLDDALSPEDQLFLERASAAEVSRALAGADGRVGLGIRGNGLHWTGSLAFTGATVNDAEAFDEQLGVVARGAYLLANDELDGRYAIQLGANVSYAIAPADQGLGAVSRHPVRFRDRPELRIDGTRLIDTGPIDADGAYAAGGELAAQFHNLYLQAEYFRYGVERRLSTLPDPSFDGGYVTASWVLTGEYRRHNIATGSFQNPRPFRSFSPANGGWGAVELAARYSWLNLDFRAGAPGTLALPAAVRGGEQQILTAGLNWYLNSNVKLLLDYQLVQVNRLNPASAATPAPFGTGAATPPVGAQIGQSYSAVSLRSQVAF
ncbi:MAG: porin [Sphingomonas sp.]